MKPKNRWIRQPFYLIALISIVGVGIAIISKKISQERPSKPVSKTIRADDWVYIPPNNHNELALYFGRPGRFVSGDDVAGDKVEYQLQESGKKEIVLIPHDIVLRRCPPQQEGVDGRFAGTIRVWKGSESKPLEEQTDHYGKLGDTITVEIKNLDRWLFTQFDFGRLKSDLEDVPPSAKDIVAEAVAARRSADLLRGVNKINHALRVTLRDQRAGDTDARTKAWQDLIALIDADSVLKRIKDKMPEKLEGDQPTPENIGRVERQFLPLKVWSHRVTERRFKQLILTLNGVALPGITPENAYNEAEVVHETRPSFQDDFYQWARFVLERKQSSPTASDRINELAKLNDNAWFKLIGKPAFWLPCNVTLRLPEEGLELPTKVTPEAPDRDCRFYLVGIQFWKFVAAVIVFLGILGFLFWLAKTTNILRDSSGHVRPDGLEPVSLGKTQMAFWFIITACAFAFLWVTTGNYDTINETCLILVGIGSGTALGAAFIETTATRFLIKSSLGRPRQQIKADIADAILVRLQKLSQLLPKDDADIRQRFLTVLRKLQEEEKGHGRGKAVDSNWHKRIDELRQRLEKEWNLQEESIHAEINEDVDDSIIGLAKKLKPPPNPNAKDPAGNLPPDEVDILASELELLALQQAEFKRMPKTAVKRLFADWLSEGASDKYSFHRFQMLAWTMLLGFIFVAKVIGDRSMPEFNTMTLALLGISAGTYLGFKIPEARKQETATKN